MTSQAEYFVRGSLFLVKWVVSQKGRKKRERKVPRYLVTKINNSHDLSRRAPDTDKCFLKNQIYTKLHPSIDS